ncbi:MAG: zinc-ribbon domain-containing protein [Chloroflexi bacterium]|nr:zinc-ribbon domain-containing protein [Chloroflexota bacterium]
MICSSCGDENRADRRFCLSCGSPLGLTCPNCGTENEARARFCGNCGQGLAAAGDTPPGEHSAAPDTGSPGVSSPTAERRLVSVLFADLVGFTPFAEERDPEEVPRVVAQRGGAGRSESLETPFTSCG